MHRAAKRGSGVALVPTLACRRAAGEERDGHTAPLLLGLHSRQVPGRCNAGLQAAALHVGWRQALAGAAGPARRPCGCPSPRSFRMPQPQVTLALLGAGGVELSFIVAVDYTASNGDPHDPRSLHYFTQRPTIYEGARAAGWGSGTRASACRAGPHPFRPCPAGLMLPCRRHQRGGAGAGVLRQGHAVPQLRLWRGPRPQQRRQPLLPAQRQPAQPGGGGGPGHPAGLQVGCQGGARKGGRQEMQAAAVRGRPLLGRCLAVLSWRRLSPSAGTRCLRCGCRAPRCLRP